MGESEFDEGIENDGREFVLTTTGIHVHVEKAVTVVAYAVIAQDHLRSQEMVPKLNKRDNKR